MRYQERTQANHIGKTESEMYLLGALMAAAAVPGLWYAVYDELKLRGGPLTPSSFFAVGVVVLSTIGCLIHLPSLIR